VRLVRYGYNELMPLLCEIAQEPSHQFFHILPDRVSCGGSPVSRHKTHFPRRDVSVVWSQFIITAAFLNARNGNLLDFALVRNGNLPDSHIRFNAHFYFVTFLLFISKRKIS